MTTNEAIIVLDHLISQAQSAKSLLQSGQIIDGPNLNLDDSQFYQMAKIGDFTVYWPNQQFRACCSKDGGVPNHVTEENLTAATGDPSGKPVNVL